MDKQCLFCNKAFHDSSTVKDVRTDNEITDLLVKCTNGCEWHGELKYIDNHHGTCPLHKVLCTKNCGALMQRSSLRKHLAKHCPLRSHKCPHCDLTGEYRTISGQGHLLNCRGMKTTCTICHKIIHQSLIDTHQKACKLEPVPCQYQSVGCTAQPRRQDISQHNLEAMSDHLQLAVQAIAQQSSEIAQLRREQQEVKKAIFSMGKLTSVVLKMENVSKYQNAKTTKGRTWYSNNFFTNCTMGYTARLRVDINGTAGAESKFVSCYICVMKEECPHLEWPFKGTFTVSILNHSESGKDYIRQFSSENGTTLLGKEKEIIFGKNDFVAFSTLLSNKQPIFLENNCLFFRVTVDSISSRISPKMSCIT